MAENIHARGLPCGVIAGKTGSVVTCSGCLVVAANPAIREEAIRAAYAEGVILAGPNQFTTKDSGQRQAFETGSQRDVATGKGRYDLLPREAVHRYAQLLERGADKYGDNNWLLGQPYSRVFSSLLRHAFQAAAGETDEDHLAAVIFNAAALITFGERIAAGELPASLNDMPWAA